MDISVPLRYVPPGMDQFIIGWMQYIDSSEEAIKLSYGDKEPVGVEVGEEASSNGGNILSNAANWVYDNILKDGALEGSSDGANTGYTNWNWESDDVQIPLKVISILTTGGAAIEAKGILRIFSFLNIGSNISNLSDLDSHIPGFNNKYFSAARDATFVISDVVNPLGVFETPAIILDAVTAYHSIDELINDCNKK